MDEIKISKEQARKFLVDYHGMLSSDQFVGMEGIIDYIKKVGCIQFDPLNVVGRNPDLVLQSKINGYSSKMLEKLLYDDRVLIDGWDKMMSIYHKNDWTNLKRVRDVRSRLNINIMKHRGTMEALEYLDEVKEIISQEGPKFAREINVGGISRGRWSSSKYSNVALDHLFHLGELGVLRKKNNQKVFDLIENLLPCHLLSSEDSFLVEDDFYKWYIKRRIGGVGMLWSRNGGGWLGQFVSDKKIRERIIAELVAEQIIVPIKIEGIKEPFYIKTDSLDYLQSIETAEIKETRFLAPLDNLLWDRDLIHKIFNFKYSWEVYVPKEKRKYGYYVLPVLYGEDLVARFEPIKPNEDGILHIKYWWWEDGVVVTTELMKSVERAFERFAEYIGCSISSNVIINLAIDVSE